MRTRGRILRDSVRAAVRVRFKRLGAITLGFGVFISEGKSIYAQPLVLGNVPSTSLAPCGSLFKCVRYASPHLVLLLAARRGTACSAPARWRSPTLRRPSHGTGIPRFRGSNRISGNLRYRNIQGQSETASAVKRRPGYRASRKTKPCRGALVSATLCAAGLCPFRALFSVGTQPRAALRG